MLKKRLVLVLLPAVLIIALFSFCACDLFYPAVDDEELVVEKPQYESYAEGFTRTSKVVDKESVADDMRDFDLEKVRIMILVTKQLRQQVLTLICAHMVQTMLFCGQVL